MENKIKLTIGIPTYNGGKYIKETIESVLNQKSLFDFKEIEILISDNASTDSTKEIIEKYLIKYPSLISYHRNEKNIGYDRNVDLLFKKAKGEYVEILGDDDFYKDEFCLDKVLKAIKSNNEIGVVLLSVDFLNITTNEILKGFRIEKDLIFENGDDFFSTTKWGTSAVSSLIIRKELWNKAELEKYFDSQWIHIGALLSILKGSIKSMVISNPIIIVRTSNNRWERNGNQLECGLKHLNIFTEMLKMGYKKETYEIFLKDRYETNFRDILFLKPKRYKERVRIIKIMFMFFKKFPLFWLFHIPAMFAPNFIFRCKMMNRIVKSLISRIKLIKKGNSNVNKQ